MNIRELREAIEKSDIEGEAQAELNDILTHYTQLTGEPEDLD